MNKFKVLLRQAEINKSELGIRLGLTKQSVSRWRDNPPQYAKAYIELLIKYNRMINHGQEANKKN